MLLPQLAGSTEGRERAGAGPGAVPHCPHGRVPAAGAGRKEHSRWQCWCTLELPWAGTGQGLAREKNPAAVHNAPSVSLPPAG